MKHVIFHCRWTILIAAVCVLFLLPTSAVPENPAVTRCAPDIARLLEQEYASLENLYFHLHSHPELSYHEEETSKRMAEELQGAGFDVTSGVGGFGVVGVLSNGDGPTVLVRADMDALPVQEETGVPYASKVVTTDDDGQEVHVMHACGHDINMTGLIGTARLLHAMREQWKGTLVFIAQPAEERGGGARAMLADGLFERFPRPNYGLALHTDPTTPAGMIGYTPGYAMANVDSVDIKVRGIGGHGARPHGAKDPVVIAAQIILALQTIVSREIEPVEPAVVTVGTIHGGTKRNIIPNEVDLGLTIRSYSDDVRAQVLAAIERIALGTARTAGLPEDLLPVVKRGKSYTPAVYHSPELVDRAIGAIASVIGEGKVVELKPTMGGEDFGRYGREEPLVPIFMFRVGAVTEERLRESQQEGGKPLPSLHSSLYAPPPKPTIKTGVTAMTAAVLELVGTAD